MWKSKNSKTLLLFWLIIAIVGIYSFNQGKTESASETNTPVDNQEFDNYSKSLSKAWKLSRVGNAPKATELFEEVLESAGSSDRQKVQALFGLGNVYQFASPSRPVEAENKFIEIINGFPNSEVVPWAMLRVGQLQDLNDERTRRKAREVYQTILTEYSDSPACDETVLELAGTYFAENDPEIVYLGLETLENYLAEHPDNKLVTSMLFRLSYWYQEVERNYKKALPHSIRLGKLKTCNPKRWAMVYWGLGQMYSIKFGEYEEALKWYDRILIDCPRDLLTYPARKKVEKMQEKLSTQGAVND